MTQRQVNEAHRTLRENRDKQEKLASECSERKQDSLSYHHTLRSDSFSRAIDILISCGLIEREEAE